MVFHGESVNSCVISIIAFIVLSRIANLRMSVIVLCGHKSDCQRKVSEYV